MHHYVELPEVYKIARGWQNRFNASPILAILSQCSGTLILGAHYRGLPQLTDDHFSLLICFCFWQMLPVQWYTRYYYLHGESLWKMNKSTWPKGFQSYNSISRLLSPARQQMWQSGFRKLHNMLTDFVHVLIQIQCHVVKQMLSMESILGMYVPERRQFSSM